MCKAHFYFDAFLALKKAPWSWWTGSNSHVASSLAAGSVVKSFIWRFLFSPPSSACMDIVPTLQVRRMRLRKVAESWTWVQGFVCPYPYHFPTLCSLPFSSCSENSVAQIAWVLTELGSLGKRRFKPKTFPPFYPYILSLKQPARPLWEPVWNGVEMYPGTALD